MPVHAVPRGSPWLLQRAQGPGRRRARPPCRHAGCRVPHPVERGPGHCQRQTGGCDADPWREFDGGGHRGSASSVDKPSNSHSFFWASMICSARPNCCRNRPTSRANAATRRDSALMVSTFGPRCRGANAVCSLAASSLRQCVRCELYNPSRRSSAPTSPRTVQAAAACTMRRLYARRERSPLRHCCHLGLRRAPYQHLRYFYFRQCVDLQNHDLTSVVKCGRHESHHAECCVL